MFFMAETTEEFETGSAVPGSGIYRVNHAAHRLSFEVALFKGENFPRCASCPEAVRFRMVRVFNGLDVMGAPTCRTPLYEMAAIDADAGQ
jgi:hypothetical protein